MFYFTWYYLILVYCSILCFEYCCVWLYVCNVHCLWGCFDFWSLCGGHLQTHPCMWAGVVLAVWPTFWYVCLFPIRIYLFMCACLSCISFLNWAGALIYFFLLLCCDGVLCCMCSCDWELCLWYGAPLSLSFFLVCGGCSISFGDGICVVCM